MAEPTAHDLAMIAKVDSVAAAAAVQATPAAMGQPPVIVPPVAVVPPAGVAARPDTVPEKFWDAAKGTVNTEALLKSYTELEKAKPAGAAVVPPVVVPGSAEAAVVAAKLDMGALATEYATGGALSEASYAALEKAGVGKEMVDQYIQGQVAVAQQRDAAALSDAGLTATTFASISAWAGSTMAEADKVALNASLRGTPAQAKQALIALKASYEAANGADPKLLQGGGGAAASGAYASRAEVTSAMRDPRYKADPAYRAEVERKVGLMEVF